MRLVPILILVPAFALVGCATCRRDASPPAPGIGAAELDGRTVESDDSAGVSRVPSDFRLLIGKGGGFTGQWSGFTVHADGKIWTWSGLGMPMDSTHAGTLSPTELDSVWADIRMTGLLDRATDGAGNLSARVEVSGGRRSRTLTWASGLRSDAPDSPEERFYQRVQRLLLERLDNAR